MTEKSFFGRVWLKKFQNIWKKLFPTIENPFVCFKSAAGEIFLEKFDDFGPRKKVFSDGWYLEGRPDGRNFKKKVFFGG